MLEFIKSLSGLLTPLIAIITTYIAIQQYRLSKFKIRHDLYDRRSIVYKGVMEFLSNISRFSQNADEASTKLLRDASESNFLFKPEVSEYIESLYMKGTELWAINEELKDTSEDPDDRKLNRKKKAEIVKWFHGQYEITRKMFKPYLTMDS